MTLTGLFAAVVEMSMKASWVIAAVLLARWLFRRAGLPSVYAYVLWLAVFFRLVAPVSFTADFSLLQWLGVDMELQQQKPDLAAITRDTADDRLWQLKQLNSPVSYPAVALAPEEAMNKQAMSAMGWAAVLWLSGVLALAAYSMFAWLRLCLTLRTATRLRGQVFESDQIGSPFVFGWLKPRIYVPAARREQDIPLILQHEQVHIRRGDYVLKPLAYGAVIAHWFNPLAWVAFACMSKDMEMSCDERVLREQADDVRGEYCQSLLAFSTVRSGWGFRGPLAFGESHLKSRIRNALRYRRPPAAATAVALLVTAALLVLLSTDPQGDMEARRQVTESSEASTARLLTLQTSYLGDASKVAALVDALSWPTAVVRDSLELQTAKEPYGLRIHFNMSDAAAVTENGAITPRSFYENAALLFALIGNVDEIELKLHDHTGQYDGAAYSFRFSRKGVEQWVAADDLRDDAKDSDTLQRLRESVRLFAEAERIEAVLMDWMARNRHMSNPYSYIELNRESYEQLLKLGEPVRQGLLHTVKTRGVANDLRGQLLKLLYADLVASGGAKVALPDASLLPTEWFAALVDFNR